MLLGKSSKNRLYWYRNKGCPCGAYSDAGYDVRCTQERNLDEGLRQGAHWADGVVNAVTNADVIFTTVGYPSDVDVYLFDGIFGK